ncbi:MAG: hypothetical protein HY763_11940 [Planctomycetes bacterium]|nr:hypothetical protein [Planctomycetota bacterium]
MSLRRMLMVVGLSGGLIALIGGACTLQGGVGGLVNLPEQEPGQTPPGFIRPIVVVLTANRPRIIRDHEVEGTAILTATASRPGSPGFQPVFEWLPAEPDNLLEVGAQLDTGSQSVVRIQRVLRDPGPGNGTDVAFTVRVRDGADPDADPGEDSRTLRVVRPDAALSVTITSLSASSIPPGTEVTLRAVVRGGAPFLSQIPSTDDECNRSGDEIPLARNANAVDPSRTVTTGLVCPPDELAAYGVAWTALGAADVALGAANDSFGTLTILALETGPEGETITRAVFRAPQANTGRVDFTLAASDSAGGLESASLSLEVAPSDALRLVVQPDSADLTPGQALELTATGQGGVPPYTATFVVEPSAGQAALGTLSAAQCASFDPDAACKINYTPAANRIGRDTILVTLTDRVTDAARGAAIRVPVRVASGQALALTVGANPGTINTLDTSTISAAVVGGTAPYTICFEIDNVGPVTGATLGGGDAGCGPIDGIANCTCNVGAGDPALRTRTYRPVTGGGLGPDTINVVVADSVGAKARASSTLLVTAVSTNTGGGGGGGGGPGICDGSPVTLAANADDASLCVGDSTTIRATPGGGAPPFNITFRLLNARQTGEGLGAGLLDVVTTATQCGNPGATVTYQAPTSLANPGTYTQAVRVTVTDGNGLTASSDFNVTADVGPVANAGTSPIGGCVGVPIALAGGGTNIGAGCTWSTTGLTGTFQNAAALNTTFTPTAPAPAGGTITLTCLPSGGCGAPGVSVLNVTVMDPATCDDGNLCNGPETCNALAPGLCVAGTQTCAAPNPHCEPTVGCVQCRNDGHCTNNDVCDGAETCDNPTHTCQAGTPLTCNPPTSQCDPVNGCVECRNDGHCDNNNVCDGVETCNNATHTCQPGTPLTCNAPTSQCDPVSGCVQCRNDGHCTNNDVCDGLETCNNATHTCQPGTPLTCNAPTSQCDPADGCVQCRNDGHCTNNDVCDGMETCNNATHACQPGTPLTCNAPTSQCDPASGCVQCRNDGHCTNNDVCDGLETCNNATHTCQAGNPLTCTDNNPCTDDSCNAASGCAFTNNTSQCDDGDLCTLFDTCGGGACTGTPISCDDGIGCSDDSCNPATGACVNAANDANCAAVIPPNLDPCVNGVCAPGTQGADPASGCRVDLEPNTCLAGGTECAAGGADNPQNDCQFCDPANPFAFSNKAPNVACFSGPCAGGGQGCVCDGQGTCINP